MGDVGYLYVLANSTMPGLVKVGKTTRSPAERALELSGVTGLPTAFIVVYEQLFSDCSAAEAFVHAYLERRGFRIADNREFFSAPVNEVVRAITLAPGLMDEYASTSAAEPADDFFDRREEPDELDTLNLDMPDVRVYPWISVLEEAQNHYYGYGDYIQDFSEALKHFRQAAKLGALPAYGYLGRMCEWGQGIREDRVKALEYYKEGARKGSVYCYWRMGVLFVDVFSSGEGNPINAEKCFSLFVKNMNGSLPDESHLTEIELLNILDDCSDLIFAECRYGKKLPSVLGGFVAENVSGIERALNRYIEIAPQSKERYDQVFRYLKSL